MPKDRLTVLLVQPTDGFLKKSFYEHNSFIHTIVFRVLGPWHLFTDDFMCFVKDTSCSLFQPSYVKNYNHLIWHSDHLIRTKHGAIWTQRERRCRDMLLYNPLAVLSRSSMKNTSCMLGGHWTRPCRCFLPLCLHLCSVSSWPPKISNGVSEPDNASE